MKKVSHIQSNTIYVKDYYVLVMDDFNKVWCNIYLSEWLYQYLRWILTRTVAFHSLQFNRLMRSYISQYSFNPGAKFLILFINPNVHPTDDVQKELAYKLFRLMYDGFNAANVILLYAVDATQYNIYVTTPYRNRTHCGKWHSNRIHSLHKRVIWSIFFVRLK